MRKPRGILSSLASNCKRKATNAATCGLYMAMWGEEPPKGKRKQGGKKKS